MRKKAIGTKIVAEMKQYGNATRAILVVLLLALPALTIRVISNNNEDLFLLPLTPDDRGNAASFEGSNAKKFARINVRVDWPRDWAGTMTQSQLQEMIEKTLHHQTRFYRTRFVDHPGSDIAVTFEVGPNRYGPFSPAQMVNGIKTALAALRMTNGPESF